MRRPPVPIVAAMVSAAAGLACGLLAGPESPGPEWQYRPDRRDYKAFRTAYPDILEPNYLPFMVHWIRGDDVVGDFLAFCRWEERDMPMRVYVTSPEIPEELQDEFRRIDPGAYVDAVEAALDTWEAELEGLVRFERVTRSRDARLRVRLVGEQAPAPDPDHQVLGTTKLGRACRALGTDPDAERLEVVFDVPELTIFLADRFGLLQPDQVAAVALHEMGHALGMRAHSPIPADLMYEVVRDRVQVRGLSIQDVNSFVSLYRIPNGTIFRRVAAGDPEPRPPPLPPTGPPMLAIAPHVDARLGFEIRPPAGWMRLETGRGLVAVDGVTWDYTSSFQVIVEPYDTIEEYLARYGAAYVAHGRIVRYAFLVVNGRRAFYTEIEGAGRSFAEEITFIETGDGRVIVVIADSPAEVFDQYRPWFRASLATLEIWP